MNTTVTELLRDFLKIRRAAMRGESVVIKTRGGNLVLTREKESQPQIFGCLRDLASDKGLDAHGSVFTQKAWNAGK